MAKPKIEHFSSPTSSNVAGATYDKATRTLEVTFHRSGTYIYKDFPADKWGQFKKATSKGTFLSQHIRPKYAGVRKEEK